MPRWFSYAEHGSSAYDVSTARIMEGDYIEVTLEPQEDSVDTLGKEVWGSQRSTLLRIKEVLEDENGNGVVLVVNHIAAAEREVDRWSSAAFYHDGARVHLCKFDDCNDCPFRLDPEELVHITRWRIRQPTMMPESWIPGYMRTVGPEGKLAPGGYLGSGTGEVQKLTIPGTMGGSSGSGAPGARLGARSSSVPLRRVTSKSPPRSNSPKAARPLASAPRPPTGVMAGVHRLGAKLGPAAAPGMPALPAPVALGAVRGTLNLKVDLLQNRVLGKVLY